VKLEDFIADLDDDIARVPGAAYHLTATQGLVPSSLLVNLRHNNALHERVVLLHVEISGRPHVQPARRATIATYDKGFAAVTLHYGFRDRVDIPTDLQQRVFHRKGFTEEDITYMIGHEDVFASTRPGMPLWRERLFALMYRNASNVTPLFNLPYERVIEIGRPVDI